LIQQNTPTPAPSPVAPVLAGGARTAPSASAIYEGFKAQRRELNNQLDELQSTRREITSQMEDVSSGSNEHKALETRMTDIDSRITNVDKMLASNAAQIAQAAAIPGAVVEPPVFVRSGPPEEAYIVGTIFIFVFFLPLSIAFARRIWRRSAAVVTSLPKEISERLSRMEHAVEATAEEVERIGEGQRFLTRLFTEGEGTRAIGVGAAQPLEKKQVKSPERLP
jgi:tetrahydromethanopterin S-methyltransferase subunit G